MVKKDALPTGRTEAMLAGSRLYFTGKPCAHGHVSPRRSSSGACDECLREYKKSPKMKAYYKKYLKDYNKKLRAAYHAAKEKRV